MNEANDGTGPKGSGWASPPRSGMERIIPPWEYRHLRAFARVRIGAGVVLLGLAAVTLVGGSFTAEAVGWAALFAAAGAANFAFATWELNINRSAAAQT